MSGSIKRRAGAEEGLKKEGVRTRKGSVGFVRNGVGSRDIDNTARDKNRSQLLPVKQMQDREQERLKIR